VLGFDASVYPASAFVVGAWTVLFGFPEAAVEAAYCSYKSAAMQQQVMWSAAVCAALLCFSSVRFVLLWVHSGIGLVLRPGHNSMEPVIAAMRLLHLIVHGGMRTLVCAAHMLQHQRYRRWLHNLQQHNSGVLAAGVVSLTLLGVAFVVSGGVWGAAAVAANREYQVLPWVFCAFRHVVDPLQIRAGMVTTLCYLLLQIVLFDPLFNRPQLLGLGANGTALLLCCVHLGVAAWLEVSTRKSFMRSALRSRAD
jgi:hypothetical protein